MGMYLGFFCLNNVRVSNLYQDIGLIPLEPDDLSLKLIYCLFYCSFQVEKNSLLFSSGRPAMEKARQETESLGKIAFGLRRMLLL